MTNYNKADRITFGAGVYDNRRFFLRKEVMAMTITLIELIAVLTLVVDVVTVCYLIFSSKQK